MRPARRTARARARRTPVRRTCRTFAAEDPAVNLATHGNAARGEKRLGLGNRVLAEMEDRSGEDRVRARFETVREMCELADAARGDHRDRDTGRDRGDE